MATAKKKKIQNSKAKRAVKNPSGAVPMAGAPMGYEIPDGIATNCLPNKRGVIGYENENRDGKSYMWCSSDDHIGGLHDKLSYLSVPRGLQVTVYENINKNGLVKTLSEGEYDLHTLKFDNGGQGAQLHDRISSLKIEGTPPDAVAPSKDAIYYPNMR